MQRRSPLVTLFALCVVASATTGVAANNKYRGKQFPDFKAKDAMTGEPLTLESLRGKVVLIDFWATWCGPCIRELPNVIKTYKEYKDRGFEVVSISLDSDRNRFERFVKSQKMDWHHVMEGGGWKTRLAKKYRINSIPAMYLLDHEGMCISDGARGPALERAVRSAVANIPGGSAAGKRSSRRSSDSDADSEPNPEVVPGHDPDIDIGDPRRVLVEIAEAREVLTEAAAPVAAIGKRLVRVGNSINSIDRQMSDPKSPSSLRRRYISMHDELVAIRNEMYVCGMLNDEIPPLPANPFDDPEIEDRRGLMLAWGELPDARAAVGAMGIFVNVVSREVDSVQRGLDRVERDLARDADSVTYAERAKALVDADHLARRCRDAWEAQMVIVDQTLAARSEPAGRKLRSELAKLKATLRDEDADIAAARKRFTTICGKLLAMDG